VGHIDKVAFPANARAPSMISPYLIAHREEAKYGKSEDIFYEIKSIRLSLISPYIT
jgi:hypothetical protein